MIGYISLKDDIKLIKKPLFITDFEIVSYNEYPCQGISNGGNYKVITSVRRLSDNIVFKIGDYIQEGCIININIKNFKIYLDIK